MSKYLTEVIGTFFLVAVIGLTGDPLAIGTTLMVMVYMGGHVSGAHYNPAVTLALFLSNKIDSKDSLLYVASQVLGAALGAFVVCYLTGEGFAPSPGAGVGTGQIILSEVIFTMALCLVVLNVAANDATKGNSYYGLAIGFTVFFAASAVGGISGGAFNPAVGIGPTVMSTLHGGTLAYLWYYLLGPCAGGVLAAWVFAKQK